MTNIQMLNTKPDRAADWRKRLLAKYLEDQRLFAFTHNSQWDRIFNAAGLPERRWEDDGGGPR